MKKLWLLGALLCGLPACGLLTDECGRPSPSTYFDVQGVHLHAIRQPGNASWTALSAGSRVGYGELRLRFSTQERYYSAATPPVAGWLPAAQACSPIPAGSLGTSERMDSLSITSTHAYDARHPAGTSLLDILDLNDGIQQQQLPVPGRPLSPLREAELQFVSPPAKAGEQQFRVYYRQTNGEVYTAQTLPVWVE